MSEGIGAGNARGVLTATEDDGAIAAEWQRIQRERLAEERAEAQDEVDPASSRRRRMPWRALIAALLAGVVAAVLANRHLAPVNDSDPVEVVAEAARLGILTQPPPRLAAPMEPAVAPPPEPAGPEVFVPVPAAAVGPPQPRPEP